MRGYFISTALILLHVATVNSDGHFYVGLLGYIVPGSDVCCENSTENQTCTAFCRLVFEVHVHGLNSTDDVTKFRLSTEPLSPSEAATFPTRRNLHNPLTFTFVKWPGEVNVSVHVFNQDMDNGTERLELVETFWSTFQRYKPENFYIIRNVNATKTDAVLKIVYRYDCAPTKGPTCFSDCIDHDDDEQCPMTSPTPVVPEVTFTGFSDKCETVDENGATISMNCTMASTTTNPAQNSSTKRPYLDSGPTPSPKQGNSTSDVGQEMTSPSSIPLPETTISSSSTKDSTDLSKTSKVTPPTQRSTPSTEKSDDPKPTVTSYPNHGTTPDEHLSKTDEEDEIIADWPFIVGGVLGGVAVIAAVGFCLYYRRQKKLLKRQEIYNVNPKILRNFEEYAENGTSGRADVPLETEQY